MPLQGIYITKLGKLSVKFSVLGVLCTYHCTDEVEIWHSSVPNFTPIGAMYCPCGTKKPQNCLMSNKYQHFTLLPVTTTPRTTWASWYQKGRTVLDFNEARDDGVAVASAASYANHLHFAPNR